MAKYNLNFSNSTKIFDIHNQINQISFRLIKTNIFLKILGYKICRYILYTTYLYLCRSFVICTSHLILMYIYRHKILPIYLLACLQSFDYFVGFGEISAAYTHSLYLQRLYLDSAECSIPLKVRFRWKFDSAEIFWMDVRFRWKISR